MGLAAVVREALERVVSPEATSSVIELALLRTGDEAMPEDPKSLATFVRGPLLTAARCELGWDVAAALLEDLTPILAQARNSDPAPARPSSGVRRKRERSRSGASESVVLVATEDRSRARALRQQLSPEKRVVWVGDMFDLLMELDGLVVASLMVVVDCRMHSVRPASLESLVGKLSPRTKVACWGWPKRLQQDLAWRRLPSSWMRAPMDAPITDVVALLRDSEAVAASCKSGGRPKPDPSGGVGSTESA